MAPYIVSVVHAYMWYSFRIQFFFSVLTGSLFFLKIESLRVLLQFFLLLLVFESQLITGVNQRSIDVQTREMLRMHPQ